MQKVYNDKSWSFIAASPAFSDGIFEESVILILDDNEEGSFGVIMNRPENKTLADLSAEFENSPLGNTPVFNGGPVGRERVSIAVWSENSGDIGNFAFGLTPEKANEILKENPAARVGAFMGCAGWNPNQLQNEIEEGSWITSHADIALAFEIPAKELWREIILRECPEFQSLQEPKNDISFN